MDNPFIIHSFLSNFLSFVPSSLPQDRFQPPERFICVATCGQRGVRPARARLLRSSRQMFVWRRGRAVAPPGTPTSVSAERGRARASGQGLVHSSTFWAKRQIDDFFDGRGGSVWRSAFSGRLTVGSSARSVGHKGERVSNAGLLKKKYKKKKNQNTKKLRHDTGSQHALFSSQCSRLPELQFCPPGHKV